MKNSFKPRRFITYRGETMSVAHAVRRAGRIVRVPTAYMRIYTYQWSVEDAVETPVGQSPLTGSGRRGKPVIDGDILKTLWFSRLPDKVIAAKMGNGAASIRRKARKMGLPCRRFIWAQQDVVSAETRVSGS